MFQKPIAPTVVPKQVTTTESASVETYAQIMQNYKLVPKHGYNPFYNQGYRPGQQQFINYPQLPQINQNTQPPTHNPIVTKPPTTIPEIAPNTFFGIFDFLNKEKEKPERPVHERPTAPPLPPRKATAKFDVKGYKMLKDSHPPLTFWHFVLFF